MITCGLLFSPAFVGQLVATPMLPDNHEVVGGADDDANHSDSLEIHGKVRGINQIAVTAADGTTSVAVIDDFGFKSFIGQAVTSDDAHSNDSGFPKAFHDGELGDAEPFHAFIIRIANNNPNGFRLDIWSENGVSHTGRPSSEHAADSTWARGAFIRMAGNVDVDTVVATKYNDHHFYRILLEELNDHYAGVHDEVETGTHPHVGAAGESKDDVTYANGTNIDDAKYGKARALANDNATDGEIHDFHIEINTGNTHTQSLNYFGYNVRLVLEKNFMLSSGTYEETFHFRTTDL